MAADGAHPRRDFGHRAAAVRAATGHEGLVRGGAELVEISERFYHGIFLVALSFAGISTLAAAVFLPLRASATDGRPPILAAASALLVLAFIAAAIRRAREVYVALRRRPQLELVAVLIAALLMSVATPLRNELWWSACAILVVIATLVPLRRALVYCLVVLIANLAAHLVSGDLHQTPAVGIMGLWIALPFWTAMAAIIPDRMAVHLLSLNARSGSTSTPPLLVNAWITSAPTSNSDPVQRDRADAVSPQVDDSPESTTPRLSAGGPDRMSRLTARQLQVVALLAGGHRYLSIAACLSISPGQVHRHVRNAVDRLGLNGATELAALAITEGIIPARPPAGQGPGTRQPAPGDRR